MYQYQETDDFCDFKATSNNGLRVFWEITKRCNLDCTYCCFHDNSYSDLSIQELLFIAKQIRNLRVQNIKLTGGEPLLHEGCTSLINFCFENQIHIDLTTNSLLMDDFFINETSQKLDAITISLDSPEPIIQNQLCKSNVHSKILHNIKKLLDHRSRIHINTIILDSTFNGLHKLADLLNSLGIKYWNWIGADHSTELPNSYYLNLIEGKANEIKVVKQEISTKYPNIKIRTVRCDLHEVLKECPAGKNLIGINATGEIVPCLMLQNNLKIPVTQLINEEKIFHALQSFKLPKCGLYKSDHCGSCDGGCKGAVFENYGDFTKPDPICLRSKII